MGAAAAEIVVHLRNDLVAGRPWIRCQEAVCLENHAGGAEAALEGVVLDESPLNGVKPPVFGKAFDRFDFTSRDVPCGNLT
jgi:hypothetical protein